MRPYQVRGPVAAPCWADSVVAPMSWPIAAGLRRLASVAATVTANTHTLPISSPLISCRPRPVLPPNSGLQRLGPRSVSRTSTSGQSGSPGPIRLQLDWR
jgi:hypothetical protein